MPRTRLLLALPLLAASTGAPLAEDARPAGRIEVDGARAEILSEPLPVGKRIELPEGWFEVEEQGTEDGQVGSFTVAVATAEPSPEAPPPLASAGPGTERPPAASAAAVLPATPSAAASCRAQRNAYLREVWKEAGIEVEDPEALIEGLDAGTSGPATAYYWFALQVDPFRSLAWSSDLRGLAGELVRCMRAAQTASR